MSSSVESPYESPSANGSPNTGSPRPHGGNVDPFAMSFNRIDGVPTQASRPAQSGASMRSTPSSPSTQFPQTHKIARVPVGPTRNDGVASYDRPRKHTSSYITDKSPATATSNWVSSTYSGFNSQPTKVSRTKKVAGFLRKTIS